VSACVSGVFFVALLLRGCAVRHVAALANKASRKTGCVSRL
jgi:hypothetical protein